jgi:outer membrane lipoprotein carrier protein
MRLKTAWTIFIVNFLCASILMADDPGPARTQLERFAEGLDTFQADFIQTVRSQDGRVQDETRGSAWLKIPDKLRWVYSGDYPEVIVADGTNLWIYDESLDQVTVKPQSDDAADSPLMLLADISLLDEQFSVTELGDFEDMSLLELRSLDTETEFERILLGLDDNGVRMMIMEDAFGQRTEIRFDQVRKNPALDPQLFSFDPPPDADLVGAVTSPQ